MINCTLKISLCNPPEFLFRVAPLVVFLVIAVFFPRFLNYISSNQDHQCAFCRTAINVIQLGNWVNDKSDLICLSFPGDHSLALLIAQCLCRIFYLLYISVVWTGKVNSFFSPQLSLETELLNSNCDSWWKPLVKKKSIDIFLTW